MATQLYQLEAHTEFLIEGCEIDGAFRYGGRIDGMYGSCEHLASGDRVFLAAGTPTMPVPVETRIGPAA